MDVKSGESSLLLNADKLATNELSDEEKSPPRGISVFMVKALWSTSGPMIAKRY